MIPFLVDGPQLEPISLAEAKTWLRVDGTEDDSLIQALIIAARLTLEAETGLLLMAQNWRLVGDFWPPSEEIPVRVGRILSVSGGRVFSAEGAAELLPAGDFEIRRGMRSDALVPLRRPAPGRARGGIEIDLRLGFGEMASAVPEPLRLAIRHMVAASYENRGDVSDGLRGVPAAVARLVQPYRSIRL